jgi:hypothetical protein
MSTIVPKGQTWTYEDYAKLPEDGQRHEIIAGEHYVNASPGTRHQHISKRLQYQLYTKIELAGLGVLYNGQIDVQLSEFDIVQPQDHSNENQSSSKSCSRNPFAIDG